MFEITQEDQTLLEGYERAWDIGDIIRFEKTGYPNILFYANEGWNVYGMVSSSLKEALQRAENFKRIVREHCPEAVFSEKGFVANPKLGKGVVRIDDTIDPVDLGKWLSSRVEGPDYSEHLRKPAYHDDSSGYGMNGFD